MLFSIVFPEVDVAMKTCILSAVIALISCHSNNVAFCDVNGMSYEYSNSKNETFIYTFDKSNGDLSVHGPHRLLDGPVVSTVSVYHKSDNKYFQVGAMLVPKNPFEISRWSREGVDCIKKNQENDVISVKCKGNKYAGYVIYLYQKGRGIIKFSDFLINGDVKSYEIDGKNGLAETCE
jgi:hypothetical protein